MNPSALRLESQAARRQQTAPAGAVFGGHSVASATKEEPSILASISSHIYGWIESIRLGLRKVLVKHGPIVPTFPRLEKYNSPEAKLKAIGRYLTECSLVKETPHIPEDCNLTELLETYQGNAKDIEVRIAQLAIEYFYQDPKNAQESRLFRAPQRCFVQMASAYLQRVKKGEPASAHDFDAFVINESNKTRPSILSKKGASGLSPRQVFAMRLMARSKKNLSEEEKHLVARALERARYDRELNRTLRSLTDEDLKTLGLAPWVVQNVSYISYKTRERDTYNRAFGKLQAITQLDKAGESIPENLRLTLHEVNVLEMHVDTLEKMLSLSPYYNPFDETFEPETAVNKESIRSCQQLIETRALLKELTQSITRELELQSGDLVQNIGQKYLSMNGEWADQREQLLFNHLKYRHTGKVCLIDGMPHVSDVWDDYRNFPIDLENLLVSDFQRIRIDKLVNTDHVDALRRVYGTSWEKAINDLYRSIEEELHSDTTEVQYQSIYNTRMLQAKVGLSYLRPSLHTARTSDRNFDSLHKKIMDRTYASAETEKGMVCSEFAAKTTIAALVELDNQLRNQLGTDDTVIRMPFSPRERLRYVNPNRLTQILDEAGCLETVKPGATLAKFFVQDDVIGVTLS